MAIDSVGTAAAAQSAPQQAVVNQEDLFRILLTQLQFQDPLKPLDNAEFIAQLAQFTSLEQARQTNQNIESMLKTQAADQSIGLLARTVEVQTAAAREVGQVSAIAFDSGSPQLTIKTLDGRFLSGIALSQVQIIQ
jgi:flagellar basal-body rod modification protein FlgD